MKLRPFPHRAMLVALVALALLAVCLVPARAAPSLPYYFDDSSPDRILLGNSYYEVALRKSNGSIAAIYVKPNKQSITLGSRWECLWGAVYRGAPGDAFTGGCEFGATLPDRFTYEWRADTATLILKYDPDPAGMRGASARVEIHISGERWLDVRIALTNRLNRPLHEVLFPCDLSFAEAEMSEVALPSLPGVALQPAFWADNASFVRKYPGWPGLFFADLVSIETTYGGVSIYPLPTGDGRVQPGFLGFMRDEEYAKDSTFYHHVFSTWLKQSETYTSPVVRLLFGGNWQGGVPLIREHLGFGALPSLSEQLQPSLLRQLVSGPLYKADTAQLGTRFSDYASIFDRVPYPGLLHPVAWQPGGHDENYPDFLPPDPQWGSTEDMAAMFASAQARGFLVMPYTNPTWWDDESPTMRNLPPGVTLSDIAVILSDGKPFYKCYDAHCGYVVEPWSPYVITRTEQLVGQIAALNSDLQFWDQVGAREWEFDFNRFAPDPLAYMDGWRRLAEKHQSARLHTEMGYGGLIPSMPGFHGSTLLLERKRDLPEGWRKEWWRPIPWASALFGDKALLYQHDLAPETMTNDKATLRWNLTMGYMLSYNLANENGGLDGEWLPAVGALQRYAVSRYVGRPALGYDAWDGPGESKMARVFFGDCTVTANWNDEQPQPLAPNTLAASGVNISCPYVGETAGALTAGVYTAFRGSPLTAGDHVIIEERTTAATTVRHPLGADTAVVAAYPVDADRSLAYRAEAIGFGGAQLAVVRATATDSGLSFFYQRKVDGEPVEHYRLTAGPLVYLPLLLR